MHSLHIVICISYVRTGILTVRVRVSVLELIHWFVTCGTQSFWKPIFQFL